MAATRPGFVVFSRGHRNRFGMPSPAVEARYRAVGAQVLDTARDGALTLEFGPRGVEISRARGALDGYWRIRDSPLLPQP